MHHDVTDILPNAPLLRREPRALQQPRSLDTVRRVEKFTRAGGKRGILSDPDAPRGHLWWKGLPFVSDVFKHQAGQGWIQGGTPPEQRAPGEVSRLVSWLSLVYHL